MRTFTLACLTIGLLSQTGCALAPKLTVKNVKPDQKAAEQYLAARRLESQGKFELARERYEEMIVKYPKNADYLHRLGVVCTQLQRFAEAENYYNRARKQDPKDASILVDMGYTYYVRGDQVKAEQTLNEALQLKPSDKRGTSNLALVLGAQGRIDESLNLLREVNDEAGALADLAYIHLQRGEIDRAEERYQDALSLNPQHKDAMNGLAHLEKQKPRSASLLAKRSSSQEKAQAVLEDDNEDLSFREIHQVVATNNSDLKSVKTANFTEAWEEENEPQELADNDDVAGDKMTSSFEDSFEESDGVIEEPAKKQQMAAAQKQEWQEDEFAVDEPIQTKAMKKPSSLQPASFEFASDEADPFTADPVLQQVSASEEDDAIVESPSSKRVDESDDSDFEEASPFDDASVNEE